MKFENIGFNVKCSTIPLKKIFSSITIQTHFYLDSILFSIICMCTLNIIFVL